MDKASLESFGFNSLKYRASKKSFFLSELLFKSAIFLMFLKSLNAWFTWNWAILPISGISILCCLPYLVNERTKFRFDYLGCVIPIALLIIVQIYLYVDWQNININGIIGAILPIVPVSFVILADDEIKLKLLDYFTRGMALIIAVSLLIWIVLLVGISLPNFGIISNISWDQYVYYNYFLCLRGVHLYSNRFHSIFLEPGHVGMICSFLLLANRFNIKRSSVVILLISVLFTLSLAAYLLVSIAFLLYSLFYLRKRIGSILLLSAVVIIGYLFFANYNDGRNVINEKIIQRLQYDKSKGDIAGNNRFTGKLEDFYTVFINRDEVWFGIGEKKYTNMNFGPNAGYKVFIVKNGLIVTYLVCLLYIFLLFKTKKKLLFLMLVLYIIAFIQRAYPLWDCELLIFITTGVFQPIIKLNLQLSKI